MSVLSSYYAYYSVLYSVIFHIPSYCVLISLYCIIFYSFLVCSIMIYYVVMYSRIFYSSLFYSIILDYRLMYYIFNEPRSESPIALSFHTCASRQCILRHTTPFTSRYIVQYTLLTHTRHHNLPAIVTQTLDPFSRLLQPAPHRLSAHTNYTYIIYCTSPHLCLILI